MAEIKFKCPYCGTDFYETMQNTKTRKVCYNLDEEERKRVKAYWVEQEIEVTYHFCPSCHEYSIQIEGPHNTFSFTYPPYTGITLPDYIPEAIRTDYVEACSILDASPKASATLSRRCLQGMIRDFWGVKAKNLVDEIDLIKDKISADEYRVLNGIRRLGNIGAHMEKDVNTIVDIDPGEAQKLIKVLELLFKDWYIARHDRNKLYQEIFEIDQDKQDQRHLS